MAVSAPERQSSPVGGHRRQDSPGNKLSFDLYAYMLKPELFRTLPCLLGILVGFATCCMGGALASQTNFYHDFHRFHEYISPSTMFYPTVSQMVSIVESKSTVDQTIVIIGGNSVFNGIGQQISELWTDELGRILGANFAVFNFANPGSLPFEGGYWTAESLLKRGRKVIFVTLAMPTQGGAPAGEKTYDYLYWDAHEKNLLIDSKERDASIEETLSAADDKEKTRLKNLKLCMQLDSVFRFQDLWSAIGYSKMFTVWTEPTAANPFKPRYKYGDFQPYPLPVEKRFGSVTELAMIKSLCNNFFEISAHSWKARTTDWARLASEVKGLVPDQFKKNCLVVIAGHPPYYMSRLSDSERARFNEATKMSEQSWDDAGYHAMNVGSRLTDEDYRDCSHLVGVGGKKMAALVAQNVAALDKQIGYERVDRTQ